MCTRFKRAYSRGRDGASAAKMKRKCRRARGVGQDDARVLVRCSRGTTDNRAVPSCGLEPLSIAKAVGSCSTTASPPIHNHLEISSFPRISRAPDNIIVSFLHILRSSDLPQLTPSKPSTPQWLVTAPVLLVAPAATPSTSTLRALSTVSSPLASALPCGSGYGIDDDRGIMLTQPKGLVQLEEERRRAARTQTPLGPLNSQPGRA